MRMGLNLRFERCLWTWGPLVTPLGTVADCAVWDLVGCAGYGSWKIPSHKAFGSCCYDLSKCKPWLHEIMITPFLTSLSWLVRPMLV